jgi:V/A-type H+-transporting ATPase subunit C
MASSIRKYAFINAKLRARISKLIPDSLFHQMMRVGTLEEALALLRTTPYSIIDETYAKTGDLKLGELELLKKEVSLHIEIEKYVKDDVLRLVQALMLGYEIENLKNAVRIFFDRKIRNREGDDSHHYILRQRIIHDFSVDRIINAENIEEVVKSLENTPYSRLLSQHSEEILREGSLFIFEVSLDHFYYRNLLETAEHMQPRDRKDSLRIIGVEIDLHNVNWIIRLRKFYDLSLEQVLGIIIPGGYQLSGELLNETYASQDVSRIVQGIVRSHPGLSTIVNSQAADSISRLLLVERLLEQIMLYEIKRILTGYPFTIGIVLSYFLLKHREMNKVKAILNAKQYRLPEEQIQGIV